MNWRLGLLILILNFGTYEAHAQDHCMDLFLDVVKAREVLPPLFKESSLDNETLFHMTGIMYRSPKWLEQTLGDLKIVKIEGLNESASLQIQVEFSLKGDRLDTQGTLSFEVKSQKVPLQQLTSLKEIYSFQALPETIRFHPFPGLKMQSIEEQRLVDKDLVAIAEKLLETIPDGVFLPLESSRDKLWMQLRLQERGMHLEDSVFQVMGKEDPAMWVIMTYLSHLELTRGYQDIYLE